MTHSIHIEELDKDVTISDSDGCEVETQVVENKVVVGYIVPDYEGLDFNDLITDFEVFSAHRHSGLESHRKMQEALGLDYNWSPDLESPEIAKALKVKGLSTRQATDEDRLATWKELRQLRQIGNPCVVVLDVYSHGGQVFSIAGEGMQCRWDTANGGAVWVPNEERSKDYQAEAQATSKESGRPYVEVLTELVTREARADLKTYNSVINGDVWGVVTEVFEPHEGSSVLASISEESCWGFVGQANAIEEMRACMKNKIESINTPKLPKIK